MVDATAAAFGGIDILVSNAGLRRQTPLLAMSHAEWREILSVALDGAFLLARAAVPSIIARGGGAIVALTGIRSEEHTSEHQSLMRRTYAVVCLKKTRTRRNTIRHMSHRRAQQITGLTSSQQ